jgi:hypothetical protein
MMNEKLDLTQRLGDAFLAQQSVWRLALSHLSSLCVLSARVRGSNRGIFLYRRGRAGRCLGIRLGGCNWHGGDVDIDINRNVNFNRNINRESYRANFQARGQSAQGAWRHDATHRRGVGYRDQGTAQRFNRGTNAQAAASREAFRGRAESGRQELARGGADRIGQGGTRDRGGAGERSGLSGREGGRGDRPAQRSGSGVQAGSFGGARRGREADAFQGVWRGSEVRSASAPGAASWGGEMRAAGGRGFHGGGGRR